MSFGIDTDAILAGAGLIFEKHLKAELYLQGHSNTGSLIESITPTIAGVELQVFAFFYLEILNEGVKPDRVSMKQFPFLVKYFKSKGKSEKDSKRFAAMTIHKWKKTGMPIAGSKKLKAIDKAVKSSEREIDRFIDKSMDMQFDRSLEQVFK